MGVNNMKVTLTQTHDSWRFAANSLVLPNGLLYIAAYLEREGFEVEIVDPLPQAMSLDALVQKITEGKPDLIGVYFTTDNRFNGMALTQALKAALDVPIMAGGPHPTLCTESALRDFPGIDICVRGEGEYSALQIAQTIQSGSRDFTGIPNVSFKQGEAIIHNPENHIIQDLDVIPFPAYHLVDMNEYYFDFEVEPGVFKKATTLVAARGCPIQCIFCCSSHFWSRTIRSQSTERIFEQIEMLQQKYQVEHIAFYDDTFNFKKSRVIEICNVFLQKKLNMTWDCTVRATNLDQELLSLMQEAGCRLISFGIESGNEFIRNKVIKKNVKQEKILEVDRIAHELGLRCDVNLMVSFPDETKEQAEDTFRLRKQLHAKAAINISRIYPGTAMEKIAREKGILKPGFSWADPLAHKKYSPLYIPGMLSEIPLYKENLSYIYMFEKLFEITQDDWTFDKEQFGFISLLKKYLSEVNYWKDFWFLFLMGISFLSWKSKKWMSWIKGPKKSERDVALVKQD